MTDTGNDNNQPAVIIPTPPAELEHMTEGQLALYFAKTNSAYNQAVEYAEAAIDTADEVGEERAAVLTERLVRRVCMEYPDATLLILKPGPEGCLDRDAVPIEGCDCGSLELLVDQVLGADGIEYLIPDAMSPIHFLVELLSEHMDCDFEAVLELSSRDWGVRCEGTCPDGCDGDHE